MIAFMPHAAFEHVPHPQCLRYRTHIRMTSLVSERRCLRGNAETGNPGQAARQLLREAVADIVVAGPGAEVDQGQDGDCFRLLN